MKILIAGLFFPYPEVTHSGGTDLYHYIQALAERGHAVSLAAFIQEAERPHLESMRRLCHSVQVVPAVSSLSQRLRKAHYLLSRPLQWVEAHSAEMRQALQDMLNQERYDILHFEHLWMAQYRDLAHGPRLALDEVDVDSLVLFRRHRQATAHIPRQVLKRWWRWTREYEAQVCGDMDLVFTRSAKDVEYLQTIAPGRNLKVLPPWFEGMQRRAAPAELVEPHSMLFVGDMSRRLNAEAAIAFCQSILPLVLNEIPDARLYIVGKGPPEAVRRLAGDHVVVTGYVERLDEWYARCQVFVAPMLVGGGIIVKILDALAYGRPVVCTTIGNEGIQAANGRDLYVADRPVLFARRVAELMVEPRRWQEMARHARQFIDEHYRWEQVAGGLERAYLELLD